MSSSAVATTQTTPSGDGSSEHSSHAGTIGVAAAMVAIPVLYLIFVLYYSKNVLFLDDWSVVPLVHAALHGGITPSALWAQHNENRMFVPNLVQVGMGVVTHDNTATVIVVSAFVFIATYAVLLATYRSYLGRPLRPLAVLLLGAVWFSILDWENALWAFQFAWYLILFFLIMMIYCFQRRWFVVAVVLAVLASFSSLQGLFLWPAGLIWLLLRKRRFDKEILIWIAAAVATTVVYFVNFSRGTVVPIWRYPVVTARFVLIELGNVVPQQAYDYRLHELFGFLILAASAFVVVQSIRHDRDCLPVALIAFGLIFDLFIALGREEFGYLEATHSNYSMPNVLIVVAIVAYACAHINRSWMLRGTGCSRGRPARRHDGLRNHQCRGASPLRHHQRTDSCQRRQDSRQGAGVLCALFRVWRGRIQRPRAREEGSPRRVLAGSIPAVPSRRDSSDSTVSTGLNRPSTKSCRRAGTESLRSSPVRLHEKRRSAGCSDKFKHSLSDRRRGPVHSWARRCRRSPPRSRAREPGSPRSRARAGHPRRSRSCHGGRPPRAGHRGC